MSQKTFFFYVILKSKVIDNVCYEVQPLPLLLMLGAAVIVLLSPYIPPQIAPTAPLACLKQRLTWGEETENREGWGVLWHEWDEVGVGAWWESSVGSRGWVWVQSREGGEFWAKARAAGLLHVGFAMTLGGNVSLSHLSRMSVHCFSNFDVQLSHQALSNKIQTLMLWAWGLRFCLSNKLQGCWLCWPPLSTKFPGHTSSHSHTLPASEHHQHVTVSYSLVFPCFSSPLCE